MASDLGHGQQNDERGGEGNLYNIDRYANQQECDDHRQTNTSILATMLLISITACPIQSPSS